MQLLLLSHMPDDEKTFLEHLGDLRWILVKSVMALSIGVGIASFYVKDLLKILRLPLRWACEPRHLNPDDYLVALGVVDPLNVFIDVALFAGAIAAAPFIFYFIGSYILPALTARERKFLIPTFAAGGFLFLFGITFCYFIVLPQTLGFFLEFNQWFEWKTQWTIQYYIDFIVQMLLAFGISFELPLVILLLAKIGLITQKTLRKYRRHAILVLFIATCCITPASDLYNLSMLFVPMYVLYEVSVLLAGFVEPRRKFLAEDNSSPYSE